MRMTVSEIDYQKKYKTLKRKLKILLFEQESFADELRKSQRKLLKVSRDRSFLLDRLLEYEDVDDSSSASNITDTSDSDSEEKNSTKKKKASPVLPSLYSPGNLASLGSSGYAAMLASHVKQENELNPQSGNDSAKKKAKLYKKSIKSAQMKPSTQQRLKSASVPMTREQLEQHLESRQNSRSQFLAIDKAPSSLPEDIFGENSNQGEVVIKQESNDEELVIDFPQ